MIVPLELPLLEAATATPTAAAAATPTAAAATAGATA